MPKNCDHEPFLTHKSKCLVCEVERLKKIELAAWKFRNDVFVALKRFDYEAQEKKP